MKNQNSGWSKASIISAFLIGVILLWSFGKIWLNFESLPVFLAGLVGVAFTVILVAAANIRDDSNKNGH